MNFSGIYEGQTFYRNESGQYSFEEINLKDLSGTNCYCDDEAIARIRELIAPYYHKAVHFLDSGNYHYMTRIWLEKVQQSFSLIVFDHHTDMQPPAFGGILSCGGWIAAAMEELPLLKEVIVIGPDQASIDQVAPEFHDRTIWFSQEYLQLHKIEEVLDQIRSISFQHPAYISVDKDVLSEAELKTNWNQGDMSMADLEYLLRGLKGQLDSCAMEVLGMDVCGEEDVSSSESVEKSDAINRRLIECWRELSAC